MAVPCVLSCTGWTRPFPAQLGHRAGPCCRLARLAPPPLQVVCEDTLQRLVCLPPRNISLDSEEQEGGAQVSREHVRWGFGGCGDCGVPAVHAEQHNHFT